MFITLLVTLCAIAEPGDVSLPESCIQEVVTDSSLAADMSMGACMGIEGQAAAAKFVAEHPLYRTHYRLTRWTCAFGDQRRTPSRGV